MCSKIRYIILILLAFVSFEAMSQAQSWRDIYEVKKKDTIYGIARMYEISIEELMEANPEMKDENYKLKKGSKIFIPKHSAASTSSAAVKHNMKTRPGQKLKVGVMLPLHDVDGDGKRMVEYYRGILMACDSLKKSGINTDVYAWNVNIDADIRTTLLNEEAKNLDIIFGPLYTKQVKAVADFCKNNDIKLVIPFSISALDVRTNQQVYQVYQSGTQLNDRAIGSFLERFKNCNTIIIDCNDSTSLKGNFTSGLRKQLDALKYTCQITNINTSDAQFAKAFAKNKKNVVVLNTGRSQDLNLVFRKLNMLVATNPSLDISMFGYNEWLQYEYVYRELYHKYDVYIPSYYYYYKGLTRISQFEQNYEKWFGVALQSNYLPRFAITGYDHAQFFLRGLYERGSAFDGTMQESTYTPLQTPLRFRRAAEGGGMQNWAYQLVHYNKNYVIDTIGY